MLLCNLAVTTLKKMKTRIQKGGMIVDVGNVIIAHWLSDISPANFHLIDYNSIPEVPGSFAALRRFHTMFDGNITCVYKATDTATEKITGWLRHTRFSEHTGIPENRVCRTLNGRDKTPHIEQRTTLRYGTTVVVDDRLEVLSHFVGVVPYLFLFRPQLREVEQFKYTGALAYVRTVQTWEEIERSCIC